MCNSTDMPYEDSRQLLVVVYSVIFAVGLPTNFLTAILTIMQIRRKNITAVYLLGLSLCELMYLSTLPLWIIYVQNDHKWTMGMQSCHVTGYIFFCNIYISILLLCCISADRYVAVVQALESRGKWYRSQTTATVITVALFTMVAVIYCPVFFVDKSTTCFESPFNPQLAYYNVSRFFVGFIAPLLLLSFMNYKIFQSIKTSCSLSPLQKAKVKRLAIAVIVIFLICFAPYHCILLIRAIFYLLYPNENCGFEKKSYTTSVVFLCFSTANAAADPFIYVLASENARKEICRTFQFCGFQLSSGSQTEITKVQDSPPQISPRKETLTDGNPQNR
nr:PREDICTED: probable G-protein coupled receptor 132 [Anolis carolinensis]XP_016854707.1 PREDICTED: probable G-protein coupled receptor 132 [Anolis carolinensis]XP_016854730.1 PREDICTED: probable G-protein coupled receptor 132 [Anolis carolinensis]|eukprot:XP_008100994.1 PREDICTED: probable G-protein coupled receptor 132 [Anolis carolinensis]